MEAEVRTALAEVADQAQRLRLLDRQLVEQQERERLANARAAIEIEILAKMARQVRPAMAALGMWRVKDSSLLLEPLACAGLLHTNATDVTDVTDVTDPLACADLLLTRMERQAEAEWEGAGYANQESLVEASLDRHRYTEMLALLAEECTHRAARIETATRGAQMKRMKRTKRVMLRRTRVVTGEGPQGSTTETGETDEMGHGPRGSTPSRAHHPCVRTLHALMANRKLGTRVTPGCIGCICYIGHIGCIG